MQNNYSAQKNDNLKVLAIGFGLILIIALITLFKSGVVKSPIQTDSRTELDLKKRENIDSTKINKITASELLQKNQTASADLSLIDLRARVDYAKEHIAKSQNMPLSEGFSVFDNLDKNKTYVLFDATCETITINSVADYLAAKNFKNIYYLEGGFSDWKNKFNPTVSAGDPKSFTDQAKVSYISSDELKKIIDQNLVLIDVRKSPEFSSGHLKGAINIPLDELEKRTAEISSSKKTILYADTGIDAFKGAVRLFDLGAFNIFTLSDGLNTWKQKGFEIVR